MLIRNEHKNDIDRISQIQFAAFDGHPIHAGAAPTEHLIVERLRAANALTLSLVAEENGEALGHIAISPTIVGDCNQGWFLLGPVGVVPNKQRQGIGSALIREVLMQLQENSAEGIVLVGDPEYYNRFDFKNFSGLSYSGVPEQFVLGFSFSDKEPEGEIIAHEAFHAPKAEVKSPPKESDLPRRSGHYLSVSHRK